MSVRYKSNGATNRALSRTHTRGPIEQNPKNTNKILLPNDMISKSNVRYVSITCSKGLKNRLHAKSW